MRSAVEFKEFKLEPNVQLAPVIYRDTPHRTTPFGAVVRSDAASEMLEFIQQYASFIGAGRNPYFRLDVYVAGGKLWVLEVNAAFVDGWGIALNLSRAVGRTISQNELTFPRCFAMHGSLDYLPEMELLNRRTPPHGIKRPPYLRVPG